MDHGADVDVPESYNCTPMLLAARWGHINVVELLLDRGADINAQDESGMSALHWPAWGGNVAMGEFLIKRGIDANLQTRPLSFSVARTPLHFAGNKGHTAFVRLLLNNGADPRIKDRDGRTALELADAAGKKEVADVLRK